MDIVCVWFRILCRNNSCSCKVRNKRCRQRRGYGGQNRCSSGVFLGYGVRQRQRNRSNICKNMDVLILSGLATGASWLCYFKALQLGDVNKVAPIDKSSTVLTMLLAFILLGEPLGVYKVISMVLIAIGTYLMLNIQKSTTEVKGYKWLVLAVMSAVFASLTAILGKVGIEGIDSTLGTAIRTVVVLIMAWMIVFVTGKKNTLKHIDRHSMLFLILSGISTGASWLCYYRALKTGQAGVVVPIDKLSIIVTIAFSYIVLKEKLSAKSWLGLILITAGTLLLLV